MTKDGNLLRLAACLGVLTLVGCSGGDSNNAVNLDVDLGSGDAGGTDMGDVADAGDVGDPDTAAPPDECTGECQETAVSMTINAVELEAARAWYGLLAPHNTASGDWMLHIWIARGDAVGCPGLDAMDEAPEQAIAINNLAIPSKDQTLTQTDGVVIDLWDSAGGFGAAGQHQARTVSVTADAVHLCLESDCTGYDAEGYIAFDLEATFPTGTASGHVFATHCPEFDSR